MKITLLDAEVNDRRIELSRIRVPGYDNKYLIRIISFYKTESELDFEELVIDVDLEQFKKATKALL